MRAQNVGVNRIFAIALIAALALATPALAEPTISDDATRVATPTDPATDESTPGSPADEASDETSEGIPVEVDEETRAFREKLARQQAIIDEFRAQLDELDRQLAIAVESYNASVEELATTRETLTATAEDLERAREAYEIQSEILSERVRLMYLEGEMSAIDLLLDAKSFSDFFNRVVFLTTMGKRDGEIVEQLASERQTIEQDMLDMASAELRAEALEFELEAQQIEIMLRIEERQQMLTTAQVDLLDLLDEEAERRRIEQQALFESIMSGADEVGINIVGGTPVETAFAYHGIPYLWGGETPAGFDCSGLVLYVFRQHGVSLPHYSGSQFLLGHRVSPADLRPGDVVFFGSPIHHVGIYVGAGYFIHAPRTGDFVKVSPLAERTDFAGARRYDWVPREGPPVGVDPEPEPVTAVDGE